MENGAAKAATKRRISGPKSEGSRRGESSASNEAAALPRPHTKRSSNSRSPASQSSIDKRKRHRRKPRSESQSQQCNSIELHKPIRGSSPDVTNETKHLSLTPKDESPQANHVASSSKVTSPEQLTEDQEGNKVSLQRELDASRKEVALLQQQLTSSQGMISSQRDTLSYIYGQCHCTICMELAWRPQALSPCGHVFCARCLVAWFEKPGQYETPLPAYLTQEQRSNEERKRNHARKKLCPQCREAVSGPPAEVWMIKGLLERIHTSILSGQGHEENTEDASSTDLSGFPVGKDLWSNIFKPFSAQDARLKPIYDSTDGIFRCLFCTSEVLHGRCTNLRCGVTFGQDTLLHEGVEELDTDLDMYDSENEFNGTEDYEDWDEEDEDFIDDGPIAIEIEDDVESSDSGIEEVSPSGAPIRERRSRVIPSDSDSDEDEDEEEEVQRIVPSPAHLPLSDDDYNPPVTHEPEDYDSEESGVYPYDDFDSDFSEYGYDDDGYHDFY